MALDTFCLLPRPPRCGPCSRTKTSGRRLTSRPMLNVISRHSPALRYLRQSCGQLPRLLDQSCPLGGALRHTSTRCPVTPAPVVVVATPTIFAATQSPRSRLSLRRCFPRFRSANSSSGVRPKDRVRVLVEGYQQGLDEKKGQGGSRLSSIGRTTHASLGRFN